MRNHRERDTYQYIEGNAVRKFEPEYEYYEEARKDYQKEYEGERKRQRRRKTTVPRLDLFSLVFMVVAIVTTAYVCVQYLQVQADVTKMSKSIASMERDVVSIRNDNNAAIEDITSAIDLQYIYKVATKELGMVHAGKDQVIFYESTKSDSVKQYGDMPKDTDQNLVDRILKSK